MTDNKKYHRRTIGNHELKPETQMMGYGYDPKLSENSLKPPIFLTSTFVFDSAQHGKDFFDIASGRRKPREGEEAGLIYSRFNNPNMEVLEDRLALYEGAEKALAFSSGMSAISTTILAYVRPGDVVFYSQPIYGGTEVMIEKVLPNFGVKGVGFHAGASREEVLAKVEEAKSHGRIALILAETPANPNNALVDISLMREISDSLVDAEGNRPPVAVDNTFLGPVSSKPLVHGADLVLYSLTKYVGGHSDLVAGSAAGSEMWIAPVRGLRGAIGTMIDPHTSWMIMRSLETLKIRVEAATNNARTIAKYLNEHPKISKVHFLEFLDEGSASRAIYDKQCTAPGSTFAFDVKGGEAEAFRFLDRLQVMKLAVSLGGTETLISHPASGTHSGVAKDVRDAAGVTDALIRISVGIEDADDLIADLAQALEAI